jgi:plasmid stability protein
VAQLIVRKIDPELKQRLRERAAQKGRSMEEEHREILRQALAEPVSGPENLAGVLGDLFGAEHGIELPDLRDRAPHEPVRLDE